MQYLRHPWHSVAAFNFSNNSDVKDSSQQSQVMANISQMLTLPKQVEPEGVSN